MNQQSSMLPCCEDGAACIDNFQMAYLTQTSYPTKLRLFWQSELKFGFQARNCGTVIPVKLLTTALHESNACQVYVLHWAGMHNVELTAVAKL